MTVKLVELNGAARIAGKRTSLLQIDPRKLSDFDAAIWGLKVFSSMAPRGATWSQALRSNPELSGDPRLAGWWTDLKKAVGGTLGDIGDKVGEWTGSAIRLVTDQEVQDGVARGAIAYASGGQSEALRALFPGVSPQASKGSMNDLGAKIKAMFSGVPSELWLVTGGLILLAIGIKIFKNMQG